VRDRRVEIAGARRDVAQLDAGVLERGVELERGIEVLCRLLAPRAGSGRSSVR
jgi:hypothetical protein